MAYRINKPELEKIFSDAISEGELKKVEVKIGPGCDGPIIAAVYYAIITLNDGRTVSLDVIPMSKDFKNFNTWSLHCYELDENIKNIVSKLNIHLDNLVKSYKTDS